MTRNARVLAAVALLALLVASPTHAQDSSNASTWPPVKVGQMVRVHASSVLEGRVNAISDSTISIVGAPVTHLQAISKVELRKRDARRGAAVGGVIGGVLGAWGAIDLAKMNTTSQAGSDVPLAIGGAIVMGLFGSIIGMIIDNEDRWEVAWSR